MINSADLIKLIDTVMFYGSPDSPIWFVGLEETDGATEEDIKRYIKRLELLDDRNSVSLRDAVGLEKYFPLKKDEPPKLQETWNGYAKLRFAIQGIPFEADEIRLYQGHGLGSSEESETCLLELLPLPRVNRKDDWRYDKYSTIDYLKSHSKYMKQVAPQRVKTIYSNIESYSPRVVVFFGKDCRDRFWNMLSPKTIELPDGDKTRPVYWDNIDKSLVVFSHHPTAHGITDEYWQSLGDFVNEKTLNL